MVLALKSLLQRFALICLVAVLSFSLAACGSSSSATVLSADDIASIQTQAEGFQRSRDRLDDLGTLVRNDDWTYIRNLIHGPMGEVGRQTMLITQQLPKGQRAEARAAMNELKQHMAALDEAARLEDGSASRREFAKLVVGFLGFYQAIPDGAKPAEGVQPETSLSVYGPAPTLPAVPTSEASAAPLPDRSAEDQA